MKIYLLRHAQRGYGKNQDTLTEIGKEQAKRTAEFFKKIKLDKIICGSKNRAKETLQPILKYQKCQVEYTSDVNEQELGIFEGKSAKEFKKLLKILVCLKKNFGQKWEKIEKMLMKEQKNL